MRTPLSYVIRIALSVVVAASVTSLGLSGPAVASEQLPIVISAQKPLGPVPGTFSTAGAFVDSGTLVTQQRNVSALPSPFGVVNHLVLQFDGQQGSFTMRAQDIETVTDDPDVFADTGVWVILNGTGAYADLRGTGDMEGTVDDAANLITRIYTGLVHFR
jgi:hypothetical protein